MDYSASFFYDFFAEFAKILRKLTYIYVFQKTVFQ